MKQRIHLDRFDTTLDIPKKQRTYETIKARVLEAGRFSVFEAQEDAGNFDRLCRDTELVLTDLGYPWTGVTLRRPPGEPTMSDTQID